MKVHLPHPNNEEELEIVVIDDYDIWNMDISLATIIHPMLVALRAGEHGYPSEFDSWGDWKDAIDTMIYSFEQAKLNYPAMNSFLSLDCKKKELEKLQTGFGNFGKHYIDLWT